MTVGAGMPGAVGSSFTTTTHEYAPYVAAGYSYTPPAYPTSTQIRNSDGTYATIIGYPGCHKCGGKGWKQNFKGCYKPCGKCNPSVCAKCLGTGWNFKKGWPCQKCNYGKAFVTHHGGHKHHKPQTSGIGTAAAVGATLGLGIGLAAAMGGKGHHGGHKHHGHHGHHGHHKHHKGGK